MRVTTLLDAETFGTPLHISQYLKASQDNLCDTFPSCILSLGSLTKPLSSPKEYKLWQNLWVLSNSEIFTYLFWEIVTMGWVEEETGIRIWTKEPHTETHTHQKWSYLCKHNRKLVCQLNIPMNSLSHSSLLCESELKFRLLYTELFQLQYFVCAARFW